MKVKLGDNVTIIDDKGKKFVINITKGAKKVKGLGIINSEEFIGERYGDVLEIGNKKCVILPASSKDYIDCLKRKAQIILPKDSAQIIMNCSIKPGDKVVEIGSGSGALTIALAKTVAPNGKVVSYDKRKDFIEIAQYNIEKAGLEKHVEFKLRDAKNGIDEKNIDSIIMDISQPWELVDIAWGSLKIGGYFCSYSPLISQVEKTVKKLRDHPFVEVYVLETLQREMIVLEKGVRPSFNMLGHTGYLTFARKTLAKV
ncbi:MAG: tRNA (adenine-N1)-methyltransferase [Thermoplasmata archaeon]|nr:tRNA (adenine-N1)-methyltransferase [Thermoplasmata archaeon]